MKRSDRMEKVYSKEETEVFKNALINVLDDLEDLWNIGVLDKIEVPVRLHGIIDVDKDYTYNNWRFIMDKTGFSIFQGDNYSWNRYWFAKRNKFGKLKKFNTIGEQDIIFLKEYDEIRAKVVTKINKALEEKQGNLQVAEILRKKYDKEATVELDLPTSLNTHEIEIEKKDGQTIGTINFGNRTIKIVTTGNIVLVNKESEKVKRK